jgi:hypothetical protein
VLLGLKIIELMALFIVIINKDKLIMNKEGIDYL